MGENTRIEWCDHTWNLVWGCVKISPACTNCYAETLAKRYGHDVWGVNAERRTFGEKHWQEPLKWNAKAKKEGVRRRVFCSSMADVFEDHPTVNSERQRLFKLIWATPQLDWLLLTKRPDNILPSIRNASIYYEHESRDFAEQLQAWSFGGYLPHNIWIGTTAENQEWADKRIPHLLKVPAKVHFLSCEPLLGEIDLSDYLHADSTFNDVHLDRVDWIITGGESGHKARPSHPDWLRYLRDQCKAASVPFFFKQWGEFVSAGEVEGAGRHHYFEDGATVRKVGKKLSGRLLDGREWNEIPEVKR